MLIPVSTLGVFSCTADCRQCTGYWSINGAYTHNNNPDPELVSKGFTFPPNKRNGSKYITTLMVNASEAANNTEIHCVFEAGGSSDESVRSERANLLVISSKKNSLFKFSFDIHAHEINIPSLYRFTTIT